MLVDGLQRLLPSPASEHLRQNAEGKGEEHPRPVHLVGHHMHESPEILTTVHPKQNGTSQQNREDDFGRIRSDGFRFHGCKDNANRAKYQIYLEFSDAACQCFGTKKN